VSTKVVKPRSFRGVPAEQRRGERKERLLQAGIRLFGARGYHGVTVREICAEAKLTERYFYESFENPPTLFRAVYARVSLAMKHECLLAVAQAPRDPLSLAEAYLRAFLGFIREDGERARIILFDSMAVGGEVLTYAENTVDDYANTLKGFMLFMFPDIASQGVNMELLAHALIGANAYVGARWLREGFRTPLEDVVTNHLYLYRALIEQAKAMGDGERGMERGVRSGQGAQAAVDADKEKPRRIKSASR
jgi:AcrR family transcriptional regulator